MPKIFVNFYNSTDAQRVWPDPALNPNPSQSGNAFFNTAYVFGYKSFSANKPVNNLAPVYFGLTSGELPFIVQTGAQVNFAIPYHRNRELLSNLWVQGSGLTGLAADGVYIVYE